MAVEIYRGDELRRLRRASRVAAQTLKIVTERIHSGMTTADIDRLVFEDTARRGATPSQLGYKGFPASVCTSRNEVVCHGIPSDDVVLEEGDLLNVDVTSNLAGYHGDTSKMVAIGKLGPEARHLVQVVESCLALGIAEVGPGARLGDLGAAIVEFASREGCSVVRDFGGHGIGREMHMDPHVSHVGARGKGLRLRTGMVFTIEPMINLGGPEVVMDADGWTVRTRDGKWSAQAEHTILVTESGAEILTLPGEF
jgi:methionyl aminopeptidase